MLILINQYFSKKKKKISENLEHAKIYKSWIILFQLNYIFYLDFLLHLL